MFTREDYLNYFESIVLMEKKMVYLVADIITQLTDESIMRALEKVGADEYRHYDSMMKVIVDVLYQGEYNKQLELNAYSLGEVVLKSKSNNTEIVGYGVTVSDKGFGLVTEQPLDVDAQYEVSGALYDDFSEITRLCNVQWSKELHPAKYLIGMQYELTSVR